MGKNSNNTELKIWSWEVRRKYIPYIFVIREGNYSFIHAYHCQYWKIWVSFRYKRYKWTKIFSKMTANPINLTKADFIKFVSVYGSNSNETQF